MTPSSQKKVEAQAAGLTMPKGPASETLHVTVDPPEAVKAVSERLLRTHSEYRVAIAQIATRPGEIVQNTEKIIHYIEQAKLQNVKVVVFPELAIPGYCAMDLLWDRDYLAANLAALQLIRKACTGITAIVGFVDHDPTRNQAGNRPTLYNSAAIIQDGNIVAVQDKTLLPNYDIFFENRYFSPPRGSQVVDIAGLKIGTEICEDLWSTGYDVDPTTTLISQGAELIVNLSASPFHLGKFPVRHNLIQQTAATHHVPFLYANLVGSYDGYDGEVVFDGRSMFVGPQGKLHALGQSFRDDLLVFDVASAQELPLPDFREVEELHDALVLGIRDYFERTGAIFRCVYIGLSGGIDSAVVAALAVEALGPDRVVGITMPSQYNSSETRGDAAELAHRLGIRFKSVPIGNQLDAALGTLQSDPDFSALPDGVAEENVQARLRMLDLMYYANKGRGLVLNTGNKTEVALDNCTIYGDMVGGFSVLGDVDKDRIYDLSRYINVRAGTDLIPQTTIDRVPSAELKPNQSDAIVMGAEPQIIAPLVRSIIEQNLSLRDTIERYSGTFSRELIEQTFLKIDRSEWKRRQAAPAIRVTPHAFGNGRRMPMGHGFYGHVIREDHR